MKKLIDMTDEELAMSYVGGNNRAFDLLLSRNQSKLYSYIMYIVRNPEQANDLFQETFVKVVSQLQNGVYQPTGKFSAWLMRIAHNVIMDSYRGQQRHNVITIDQDVNLARSNDDDMLDLAFESQIINEQTLADVKMMMNMLPELQREVVYMHFFQKLTFREIAEATNVSINTALGRMRYAILGMRKMARNHNMSFYNS